MLNQSRHSGDRKIGYIGGRQIILKIHAELSFAGGNQGGSAVLGRLLDIDLDTGFFKISQLVRHVNTGMVGVRSPVQYKGDGLKLLAVRG